MVFQGLKAELKIKLFCFAQEHRHHQAWHIVRACCRVSGFTISLKELKTSGLETKNDINHRGPSDADIVYIVNSRERTVAVLLNTF